MFKLLLLLSVFYSSVIQASFSLPTIDWQKLSFEQQAAVWVEYRQTLSELDVSEADAVASGHFSLIQEAYAAGYDCLIAGWPSSKAADGKCASPKQMNARYKHHLGCQEKQLLCNPAIFGESVCVDFATNTQKNGAFAQCEKKFAQKGRLFSEVLSEVDPDEMQEVISTVHNKCSINSSNYSCQQLRKKLDFLIPNETPVSYKKAQQSLASTNPDSILEEAKDLQREMESDLATFKKVCTDGVQETEKLHCKNLALRVKKSEALLPKLLARVDSLLKPDDCVNCSSAQKSKILNLAAVPKVPAENLQCTEQDKKQRADKCFEDVKCVMKSSIMSAPLAVMEAFGKKPDGCMSSQNSCLNNVISALIDSLVSLVTGLWDLMNMAYDWTGKKLTQFWEYVTKVEDKTSDAQHMLNKMSAKDIKEVKQNPVQWITSLATNIWKGLGDWMKEDIFCEKWSGIPRASQCVQPMRGFECMSCRTMITGTCSVAGVVIAEVVPALLTGGSVNLVSKAGSAGAKAFSNFIKVSKSYKKVVAVADKLADVRAIKLLSKGTQATGKVIKVATKPISQATKMSMEVVSSGYKAMVKTKGYQGLSKAMDVAAKYTGIKAYNKLQVKMYQKGYDIVDSAMGVKPKLVTTARVTGHAGEAQKMGLQITPETQPIYDGLIKMDEKVAKLRALREEASALSQIKTLDEVQTKRAFDLIKLVREAEGEVRLLNNKFTDKLATLYKEKNIPTIIVEDAKGSKMLKLDFSAPQTKNGPFEMFRQVQSKFGLNSITISAEETLTNRMLGFFQPSTARIEMGPGQAFSMMEDYFNSVSKHESRHAMFFAKRSRGDDSIFHARFYGSQDGYMLNTHKYFYDNYMSAEELYTFSTDVQSLAQVFKGEAVTDLAQRAEYLGEISEKAQSLKIVAGTTHDVTDTMIANLDELLTKPNRAQQIGLVKTADGNFDVTFGDVLNRGTTVTLVGKNEKKMAQSILDTNKAMVQKLNNGMEKELLEEGYDLAALENRINTNAMTDADKVLISKVQAEYLSSPEGRQVLEKLDKASIPLINNSRKMLNDLKQLSAVQLKEADELERLVKIYGDAGAGGTPEQYKALRDQMFKTAKNVKEDYKGYALKVEDSPNR